MKLVQIIAASGLAMAVIAGPATAQHRPGTTVRRVHGPLKILPHHNRKVCRTRIVNHRRVQKCSYR